MPGPETSVFGWIIRFGMLFLVFTFSRTMSNGTQPAKTYRGALIFSAVMAVIAWATYGTHSEGNTSYVPYGDNESFRVQDFKPSNEQSVQHGFLMFLVIAVPALLGVYAGPRGFKIGYANPISLRLERLPPTDGNPLLRGLKRMAVRKSEENIGAEIDKVIAVANKMGTAYESGVVYTDHIKELSERQKSLVVQLYGPIPLELVKAEYLAPLMGNPEVSDIAKEAVLQAFEAVESNCTKTQPPKLRHTEDGDWPDIR